MSFHLCSPCCFAFPQAAASCQDAQWLSLSTAPGNAHSWLHSTVLLGEGIRKENKTQTTHKVTEATHLYLWKYQITSEPRWNSCDAEDGESGCNDQWEQRGDLLPRKNRPCRLKAECLQFSALGCDTQPAGQCFPAAEGRMPPSHPAHLQTPTPLNVQKWASTGKGSCKAEVHQCDLSPSLFWSALP